MFLFKELLVFLNLIIDLWWLIKGGDVEILGGILQKLYLLK